MPDISLILKVARERMGKTKKALAAELGVSLAMLAMAERHLRKGGKLRRDMRENPQHFIEAFGMNLTEAAQFREELGLPQNIVKPESPESEWAKILFRIISLPVPLRAKLIEVLQLYEQLENKTS